MLKEMLFERKLPPVKKREDMLETLQREEYGYLPAKPDQIEWKIQPDFIPHFCAGKAYLSKVTAVCSWGEKSFSFPFYTAIPSDGKKHPFFIHINFRDAIPDRYMPSEELIDHGFAVLSFCYEDITRDDGDFTNGLCGLLFENGRRTEHDPGKIAIWAWAAQRVMDYAQTKSDRLDLNASIVCGHSRLGKTALLTAATDERFRFCYANNSGCCGAALSRSKTGEDIAAICERFPYWFCERLKNYIHKEYEMPFDQHELIACIAPRFCCIGNASEDDWCDPLSELLSCIAASTMYQQAGYKGLIFEDHPPRIDDQYFEGRIGYHMRKGKHYFSRQDWLRLIAFVKTHLSKSLNI